MRVLVLRNPDNISCATYHISFATWGITWHFENTFQLLYEAVLVVWMVSEVSRRGLESVWKVYGRCQESVWKILWRCLLDAWKFPGGCLDGVRNVPGRCLKGVWKVTERHLEGVLNKASESQDSWILDRSSRDSSIRVKTSQDWSNQDKSCTGWIKKGQVKIFRSAKIMTG